MNNYVTGVFGAFLCGGNLWMALHEPLYIAPSILLGVAFSCGFVALMSLIREAKS